MLEVSRSDILNAGGEIWLLPDSCKDEWIKSGEWISDSCVDEWDKSELNEWIEWKDIVWIRFVCAFKNNAIKSANIVPEKIQ